jgi:uncharacterized protein
MVAKMLEHAQFTAMKPRKKLEPKFERKPDVLNTPELLRELCAAAKGGRFDRVEELIAAGVNPNGCDQCGALEWAIKEAFLDISMFLLQRGANPNRHSKHKGWPTPLLGAVMNGWDALVTEMVIKGVNVNQRGSVLLNPKWVTETKGNFEITSLKGDVIESIRPVALAKRLHKPEIELILLEAGGTDGVMVSNRTVEEIKHDAFKAAENDDVSELEQIIEHCGGDIVDDFSVDCSETLLISAARNGASRVVELLIRNGANPNLSTTGWRRGLTPLMVAAEQGHVETVKLLLDAGGKPGGRERWPDGSDFGPPLFRAVEGNHYDVVELLLSSGAKISEQGFDSYQEAKRKRLRRIVALFDAQKTTRVRKKQG